MVESESFFFFFLSKHIFFHFRFFVLSLSTETRSCSSFRSSFFSSCDTTNASPIMSDDDMEGEGLW